MTYLNYKRKQLHIPIFMKQMNYILKGMVACAVLTFFISCNKQTEESTVVTLSGDSIPLRLPIAYISTDSLLANYQFVIDKNEEILKKLEDQRLNLGKRTEKLQKEILEYQQKVQGNVYYSRERQQQEETRLSRQEQELNQAYSAAQQELALEEQIMHRNLQDTLDVAIRDFNKGKYQAIFSNSGGSTFFYMDDSYDITKEVTDFLNARYMTKK